MNQRFVIRINKSSDELKDKGLSIFICAYYSLQAFNLFVKITSLAIPGWYYIPKVILALLLLVVTPVIITRARGIAILIEFLMAILFLFSYFWGSHEGVSIIDLATDELLVFIPIGICAFAIIDYSVLLQALYRWSFLTHAVLYVLSFLLMQNRSSVYAYSMSVGYAILLQQMIVLDRFFTERKPIDLVIAVLDLFLIILLGSRGPLLCLFSFFVFRVLSNANTTKKKMIVIVSGIIVSIVFYLLYPVIIRLLLSMSKTFLGNVSRTLRLLLSDQISYEAGREVFITYTIERISEKPITGWGLGGGWLNGNYPHNLMLEIILAFGIPVAILLFISFIVLLIKGMKQNKMEKKRLFLIFLSFSVSLLFSGSFLTSSSFFVFLLLGLKRDRQMYYNDIHIY